jgi:hypothetical protein
MEVVALNSVLILVNIILELAVLGTIAVLINRNARRMRMVQQQLVAQSNEVFLDSITAAESDFGVVLPSRRIKEAVRLTSKESGSV